MLKDADDLLKDGEKLLGRVGLAVVLEQALDALIGVLFVICSTEVEAIDLQERAGTEKLRDYWRGRAEGAWSIRRHADSVEPAIRTLQKLLSARTPIQKSHRKELVEKLKQVKALRTKIRKAKAAALREAER